MKQLRPTIYPKALFILAAVVLLSCSTSDGSPTPAEAFLRDFNIDRLAAYERYKGEDIFLTGKAIAAKEYEGGEIILGLMGGARLTENFLCYFRGLSPAVRGRC